MWPAGREEHAIGDGSPELCGEPVGDAFLGAEDGLDGEVASVRFLARLLADDNLRLDLVGGGAEFFCLFTEVLVYVVGCRDVLCSEGGDRRRVRVVRSASEEAFHARAVDARVHLPPKFAIEREDERREVVVVVLAGGGAGEVQTFHLLPNFRPRRAADRVAFGHVVVGVVVAVVVRAVGAGGRRPRRSQKITRYLKRGDIVRYS